MSIICCTYLAPAAKPLGRSADFEMIEFPFECVEDVCKEIATKSIIAGSLLWTSKTDVMGERKITKRQFIALNPQAILRVELPSWRFIEEGV